MALSNKGREQALWLGKRLASMHARGVHFDEIYASTATRAADTASIACAQLSFPVTIKHSDQIVELSQGSWERMDRNSVYTKEVLERINNNNRCPRSQCADEYIYLYLCLRACMHLPLHASVMSGCISCSSPPMVCTIHPTTAYDWPMCMHEPHWISDQGICCPLLFHSR